MGLQKNISIVLMETMQSPCVTSCMNNHNTPSKKKLYLDQQL